VEILDETIVITKSILQKALQNIGEQKRFPVPGRFILGKMVYKDDREIDDSNSAVEIECWNEYYEKEGIDALFEELKMMQ